MLEPMQDRITSLLPDDVDHCSIRYVEEQGEHLAVRQGVVQPVTTRYDAGAMATVWHAGGVGYAATSDLTDDGIRSAIDRARRWAAATAGLAVLPVSPLHHPTGGYESAVRQPWDRTTLTDRLDLLRSQDSRLGGDARIVDRAATLDRVDVDTFTVTNRGGRVRQRFHLVFPGLRATANAGSLTQTRTFGEQAYCGQGGMEVLDRYGFGDAAERVADEAVELLSAPNCPSGTMDLLLAPDQMVLQIHESIGHPLELDRILGDERNYAGTSFVTPEMFGTYRYGSELLDVTFDPTVDGQLAGYRFDDDGTPAQREHLIRDGILVRPIGGTISQARAGLPGVASSRASGWNRPPIDRMANINLEAGDTPFDELVSRVERGVYLETNNSWSIDDSRNKFQFGCERGRLIEDGELTTVVRNPGYRGISATFWRSLIGVGTPDTVRVMGTPNCGKGEPNQQIWSGHASPACLFRDVAVFGGAS